MISSLDAWVLAVEQRAATFASSHGLTYAVSKRQQSAFFEIGCLLGLVDDYEKQGLYPVPQNLDSDGAFRYLTTPSGKPNNFSWLRVSTAAGDLDIRQQIRIRSHLHHEVAFTPDFAILDADAPIEQRRDPDYAGGRRGLFAVESKAVVSAFECKSMPGFPELFISFVGMLVAAHDWIHDSCRGVIAPGIEGHLAPTLFVGGVPSNLHKRMVDGLEAAFPMNIITGVHRGAWTSYRTTPLRRLPPDLRPS